MMKQVPTAVTIGDTTGGGGGIPEGFPLPSGTTAWIPRKEERRHDGVPIEWNGIPPTTRVANTAADLSRGKDNQLEYAMQLLRTY
jgi:C-terminal processing protease CtpA/Prc